MDCLRVPTVPDVAPPSASSRRPTTPCKGRAMGVPWACFHMHPFFSLISAVLHHERHSHPSPWSGRGLTPPHGPPGQGVTQPAAWEHRTSLVAFYYYTHSQEIQLSFCQPFLYASCYHGLTSAPSPTEFMRPAKSQQQFLGGPRCSFRWARAACLVVHGVSISGHVARYLWRVPAVPSLPISRPSAMCEAGHRPLMFFRLHHNHLGASRDI
jgi:hypothetical protein